MLSVGVVAELAPGPPIHQRWGKDETVRQGLGSGSRVLALHPITSDG